MVLSSLLSFSLFLNNYILPVVTVNRADSRTKVSGFKGVFFWKTGHRNQLPS